MTLLRSATVLFTVAALLSSAPAAFAQHSTPKPKAPTAAISGKGSAEVITESLSGLDLVPYRKTGLFGIRINHRISQPATLRLIDVKTSRYLKTEMLEPSPALTRAVQVGHLASGEYKMEIVMTDTTYWKTVRVSR